MDLSAMRKPNDGFQIYQNSGYDRGSKKRTLVIDIGGRNPSEIDNDNRFTANLAEPFTIDKMSDVYLDSFTTYNALANNADNTGNNMAFRITLDDFNIQTGSREEHFRTIIIPNEDSAGSGVRVHKGRKLNYISCEPPRTLKNISGKITGLGGATIAGNNFRFIMELVFIER